jgi:hypothetical protein
MLLSPSPGREGEASLFIFKGSCLQEMRLGEFMKTIIENLLYP